MNDWWRGRRILVTGAAGFVASNLIRQLRDLHADVVGLDVIRDSPSLRVLGLFDVPILIRDVRNWQRVHWAMLHGNGEPDWQPPEIVFHLAGMSHPKDCQANPVKAWENNVAGAWNVLEACRQLPAGQIRAVVCASSDRVYGSLNPGAVPFLENGSRADGAVRQDSARTAWWEDDPPRQTEVYGLSKACLDLLVRAYGKGYGLPAVALRHQNAFGCADPWRSHLVPGAICDLLEGRRPRIRGDGSTIKGYLAVEDVVQAYLILAERAGDLAGEAVNAAPDRAVSVLEMVRLVVDAAGRVEEPDILREDLTQSGQVEVLSNHRLRELGWAPSDTLTALRHTWAWYQKMGGMAWSSA